MSGPARERETSFCAAYTFRRPLAYGILYNTVCVSRRPTFLQRGYILYYTHGGYTYTLSLSLSYV